MAAQAPDQIGFPPPLLSDRPVRLPVVWNHPLGFAVHKPTGVALLPDNWYPRTPLLAEAINYQAAQGKGELERLGLGTDGARAIYQLEPDLDGVALFAKDAETGDAWTNAYGSELFTLTVHFLSQHAPDVAETVTCDLPIARHLGRERRMLVSHRTGKKTETQFQFLERFGRYALWEAKTRFLRLHQIRLHAYEVGLRMIGDGLYADEPPLYLSRIKRDFRVGKHSGEEQPLYDGPTMFLSGIEFPLEEGAAPTAIDIKPPKRFTAVLRNLRRYG